ncbi:unnamed protein product [Eruca vesicaria subsp. sativa]|uniref:Uncharacterized protein n=1 Tax=Eruca vesicaria subsp. sativa TaxID=29727 RepID=A0ABC8KF79_ERUVS|nr:unnamed protein product [Eruca vesicaria subsp. sativa]
MLEDSFENLLFSVCRFRELTGSYPHNITAKPLLLTNLNITGVSYDSKEERFGHSQCSAMGFPESRFFYLGPPASVSSKEGALKGEAMVRAQFQEDPYGVRSCSVTLSTALYLTLMAALR